MSTSHDIPGEYDAVTSMLIPALVRSLSKFEKTSGVVIESPAVLDTLLDDTRHRSVLNEAYRETLGEMDPREATDVRRLATVAYVCWRDIDPKWPYDGKTDSFGDAFGASYSKTLEYYPNPAGGKLWIDLIRKVEVPGADKLRRAMDTDYSFSPIYPILSVVKPSAPPQATSLGAVPPPETNPGAAPLVVVKPPAPPPETKPDTAKDAQPKPLKSEHWWASDCVANFKITDIFNYLDNIEYTDLLTLIGVAVSILLAMVSGLIWQARNPVARSIFAPFIVALRTMWGAMTLSSFTTAATFATSWFMRLNATWPNAYIHFGFAFLAGFTCLCTLVCASVQMQPRAKLFHGSPALAGLYFEGQKMMELANGAIILGLSKNLTNKATFRVSNNTYPFRNQPFSDNRTMTVVYNPPVVGKECLNTNFQNVTLTTCNWGTFYTIVSNKMLDVHMLQIGNLTLDFKGLWARWNDVMAREDPEFATDMREFHGHDEASAQKFFTVLIRRFESVANATTHPEATYSSYRDRAFCWYLGC